MVAECCCKLNHFRVEIKPFPEYIYVRYMVPANPSPTRTKHTYLWLTVRLIVKPFNWRPLLIGTRASLWSVMNKLGLQLGQRYTVRGRLCLSSRSERNQGPASNDAFHCNRVATNWSFSLLCWWWSSFKFVTVANLEHGTSPRLKNPGCTYSAL